MDRVIGSVRHYVGGKVVRLGLILRGRPRRHEDPDHLPPLTASETRQLLDQRSRRELNLSADEFVAALRARRLPDTSAVRGLAMLVGEDL